MGLFDVFKKKELSPEEAYRKAFSDFIYKSTDEKYVAALEGACEMYPDGWQGRLVLGLAYLMGSGVEFNEEKGLSYLNAARQAGDSAGSECVAELCEKLEEDCGNLFVEYSRHTQYVRKLGCIMMLDYGTGEKALTRGFTDDDDFLWTHLFLYCRDAEQKMPFFIYRGIWDTEDKKVIDDSFAYIRNERDKLLALSREDVTPQTVETWLYILGFGLALGPKGPFAKLKGRPGMMMDNLQTEGHVMLWEAAFLGCLPAIHLLATFVLTTNLLPALCHAFSFVDADGRGDEEAALRVLLGMLKTGADKGDAEAQRLMDALLETINDNMQEETEGGV